MDTQHIGKAKVINCEFEYECPLDWFNLDTTDDPNVRHCGECKKSVTFCENLADMLALRRTNPGSCVALRSGKITTINASNIRLGLPRQSSETSVDCIKSKCEGEEK